MTKKLHTPEFFTFGREPLKKLCKKIESTESFSHNSLNDKLIKAEKRLRKDYDIQNVINSVSIISLESISLKEMLTRSLDLILSIPWISLQAKGSIFMVDNKTKSLHMEAQRNLSESLLSKCAVLSFGQCLCGLAASTREIVFSHCIDERHQIQHQGILPHGHYCIPIQSSEKLFGVINLYVKEGHKRKKIEEEFLTSIANTLAGTIERKKTEDLLKESCRILEHRVEERTAELVKLNKQLENEIEERKKAEEMIQSERMFLQSVIDGVSDPILVVGKDYHVKLINRVGLEYKDWEKDNANPLLCCHIVHEHNEPCEIPGKDCPISEVFSLGKPVTINQEHINAHGYKRFFEIKATPMKNSMDSINEIIIVYRDITERKIVENKLREKELRLNHLAHHDPLTGLPNRLLFYDRMHQASTHARRNQELVALLFIDLDRFKNINDTLGHDIGDMLLKSVAERLKDCVRECDTIARLGGDEFTIILEQITNGTDAALVAKKILKKMSKSFKLGNEEFFVSLSIGISLYPIDAENIEDIIKNADLAMYRAKERGRNNYQFYTTDMDIRASKQLSFENSLRKALDGDEFSIYYQPQVDLCSREIIGVEALLRWRHPEMGLLNPSQFLPLAEELGLIVPIGEWVLYTACLQNKIWQKIGFPSFYVAVNLSNRQFRQNNLIETIIDTLKETGLSPKSLELELTENIIMQDAEEIIVRLDALKTMGIKLSIDDFGTGYSNLSNLLRLQINKLKIDRSFIQDITSTPDNAAIVTAVISLARNLDLNVIAEGVETEEQLTFLYTHQCNAVQGYYFGRPMTADSLTQLLQKSI